VRVEIQAGGRSLIRVTDDGMGMNRDDALLCLERHATSKIRLAEDLAAIGTMGFRGEALPSIASVSRFTLTTRERESDSPEGTQVVVSGGKIVQVKAAGIAPGTSIEVRQLFFNLPARRKFLRTEETESAHIQHYLTLAALSFPDVGFQFHRDGRLVWQLPAVKTGTDASAQLAAVRERLRALYGGERQLLAVDFEADLPSGQISGDETAGGFDALEAVQAGGSAAERVPDFRVWGFIGAPGVSRATREDQHLFVNRRPIENRGLNYALLEGYHTALMKGRYPVCCLFLEIDPAAVDVNIHPAKREVKFHREPEVRRLVTQAVREALLSFHKPDATRPAQPTAGGVPSTTPAASTPPPQQPGPESEQHALPNFPSALQPAQKATPHTPSAQPALRMGFGRGPTGSPGSAAGQTPGRQRVGVRPPHLPEEANRGEKVEGGEQPVVEPIPEPVSEQRPPLAPVRLLKVPLRLIGVVGRLYVLFESDRGLVLLDQHAAHERILFEQMLNRLEQQQQAPSQKLLLPETLELSARDANFVREQLPVLTRLGVGLSEFGERTFLLDALPPFVHAADPRRFVIELVDELKATGREVNTLRLGEHTVAKTVCRHAVKAHDPLSGKELEALVEELRHCAMPYTCPHGRPTLMEMNFRELEKKFGRTH